MAGGEEIVFTDVELLPQRELQLSASRRPAVVKVRGACKHYGSKRKPHVVLDKLNMTVPAGQIYALLGASGCGKTTLLNCILGQRTLNSGEVWVLGGPPGTESSGVPGTRVGYMPQDISLYGDFTIEETFRYFGTIAQMDEHRRKERSQLLRKLFRLPDTHQRVKTFSGGQQRIISLATALLYEPELVVLDEPTVGADPLLREDIWNHLLRTCEEEGTTIIITTHYIEEARQAHIVGLMREGELIAEEPPEVLLTRLDVPNLDDAFTKLSIYQNSKNREDGTRQSAMVLETDAEVPSCSTSSDETFITLNETAKVRRPMFNKGHLRALLWKNLLWWIRNAHFFIATLALSILMIASLCLCVGPDPRNLPIAVVNHETNNSDLCSSNFTCRDNQLSCHFLQRLKEHSLIMKYYESEDEARQSVIQGDTYASMIISHNYSAALRRRFKFVERAKPWNVNASNIDVFRDVSDSIIASYLKIRMYDTYKDFVEEFLALCDLNTKALQVPVRWNDPIYGVKHPSFTDFMVPGALVSMIYILAMLLTATVILIEKSEVGLERTLVMGIKETEVLLAHIVWEFLIMVLQSILAIVTAFAMFDTIQRGSYVLVTFFTILSGFSGMSFGLLISCACNNVLAANIICVGCFLPITILTGFMWPIEGMHYILRSFCPYLPLSAATQGLRSILQKNSDFSDEMVFTGFAALVLWTALYLALCVFFLKFRKN